MKDSLKDLVDILTTTTVYVDDIFLKITNLLQEFNVEFILENFHSLLTLEHWAWNMLSREDQHQSIIKSNYYEFFENLALFNKNLIFISNEIDANTKSSLLIPETIDIINNIFEQIELNLNENDLYFLLISLWFDNLSYFIQEHTEFIKSSIIININHSIGLKFVMTDQYKFYLNQLQQTQLIFTNKQIFYLKTCSFSLSSFFFCKKQIFPFIANDILHFLAKDYLNIIYLHSFNVQLWSKELLCCISHLINFIHTCCWWRGDIEKHLKILLSSEEIAHNHIQLLINIINYEPYYQEIKSFRFNNETILIDSILAFILRILEIYDLTCFIRHKTCLVDLLLSLTKIQENNLINLCAYAILGEILCDENLKELKITNHVCEYFFHLLELAWNHPAQIYERLSVQQLLRGFLPLAKNDSIQQTTADTNKISLLIDISEQYSIVYDILWALSFNQDIQQQLRSNTKFMFNISHLKHDINNEQMRKITYGILWNLEFNHEDHTISKNNQETLLFDIMISYSHKDKILCKKIYDELINVGYRVWIDFDQMHGNVMDAMAQAIEQSKIILICMSDQYRRSNYCRAEAYYAFQRQLKIVPVLLQENYKPDGWLLFLIGQLFYVDFIKYDFLQAMKMLFEELKASDLEEKIHLPIENTCETDLITSCLPLPLPLPGSVSVVRSKNIIDWTEVDVQQWLIEHNLMQMSRLLSDYNGVNLICLNRYLTMGEPERIMKLLEDDSMRRINQHLSLLELARFQSLIEQEQKQYLHSKTNKKKRISLNFCKTM